MSLSISKSAELERQLNLMSDIELESFYESCIQIGAEKKKRLFLDAFDQIGGIAKRLGVSENVLIENYNYYLQSGELNESDRVIVPKYKNPFTGETWSGRGNQPVWMRKLIEQGEFSSKDDFLI